MAKYEHKPGKLSLFENDKGDNPKRPDFTGSGKTPDGRDFKVSVWDNRNEQGGADLSGSIEFSDIQVHKEEAVAKEKPKDEDLPF